MAAPNRYITRQGDEIYDDGEVLADVVGNGASQAATFASKVQLIWVRATGGDARVQPFTSGADPTATLGWLCPQDEPVPLTIETASIRIFAAVGVTVHVIGYRYA